MHSFGMGWRAAKFLRYLLEKSGGRPHRSLQPLIVWNLPPNKSAAVKRNVNKHHRGHLQDWRDSHLKSCIHANLLANETAQWFWPFSTQTNLNIAMNSEHPRRPARSTADRGPVGVPRSPAAAQQARSPELMGAGGGHCTAPPH
eukprot:6179601-Pleurochrysis_carterae.AAC.4